MTKFRLGLIAHDQKKDALVKWCAKHEADLAQCEIWATGTTGSRIVQKCSALSVSLLKSGPLGGDQQMGALIAEGKLDALVFFVDPLSPHPHDVDVKALNRLAIVYDIPMACNRATAELMFDGYMYRLGARYREAAAAGVEIHILE